MTGYHNYSMSNNAINAYNEDKKPLSKFKKSDFLSYDLTLPVSFYKWMTTIDLWTACEWHHSSKHYNKTYFYSIDDLVETIEEEKESDDKFLEKKLTEWKEEKRKKKEEEEKEPEYKVICYYVTWGGSRRYPKKYEHEEKGVLIGDWIYLDGGGKKNKWSNNTDYKILKE